MEKEKSRKSEVVRHHIAATVQNMILRLGIENVSARKAAAEAGYSLGTIYNHFKSFDEVLWYSRSLLIEEMGKIISAQSPVLIENTEGLKKAFGAYLVYLNDNPHVYRFLYFFTLKIEDKTMRNIAENPDFPVQMQRSFAFLVKDGGFTQEEVATITKTILFTIHGILTLVITDNDNFEAESSLDQLSEIIDFLTHK